MDSNKYRISWHFIHSGVDFVNIFLGIEVTRIFLRKISVQDAFVNDSNVIEFLKNLEKSLFL